MFLNYFRVNKTPLLGLDIHTTGFKLVQLKRDKKDLQVLAYAVVPLSEEIAPFDLLKKTVRSLNLNSPYVAIGLSPDLFFSRQFSVPKQFSESDIQEQIILEAAYYIPYPLEKVYYDFSKIGISKEDPNFVDVKLVAAEINSIQKTVDQLKQIGLQTTIIDISPGIMERAYQLCKHPLPNEATAKNVGLIDFSHSESTLYVFKEDQLSYQYSQRNENTRMLTLNALLQDFFSKTEHKTLSYLLLAGELFETDQLMRQIQTEMGIQTAIVDPFRFFKFSSECDQRILKDQAPQLMMALGLALRGVI